MDNEPHADWEFINFSRDLGHWSNFCDSRKRLSNCKDDTMWCCQAYYLSFEFLKYENRSMNKFLFFSQTQGMKIADADTFDAHVCGAIHFTVEEQKRKENSVPAFN